MGRPRKTPTNLAVPITPNAKYFSHCKNCSRTILQFPNDGPKGGSRFAHPLIETFKVDGIDVTDVVGWTDHCSLTKVWG
jgi:hypothetical protein